MDIKDYNLKLLHCNNVKDFISELPKNISIINIIRYNNNTALLNACINNYEKKISQLCDYGLNANDIRGDPHKFYNFAIQISCFNGNINIVKMFIEKYCLTIEDLRSYGRSYGCYGCNCYGYNACLFNACLSGNKKLIKYIINYGLTRNDIKEVNKLIKEYTGKERIKIDDNILKYLNKILEHKKKWKNVCNEINNKQYFCKTIINIRLQKIHKNNLEYVCDELEFKSNFYNIKNFDECFGIKCYENLCDFMKKCN